MKETVKDRILKIIDAKKVSIRMFERQCGFSNGYLRSLVDRPSTDKIDSILKAYPDINKVWLLAGEGEMFGTTEGNVEIVKTDDNALWLPVINLDTRGGLLPNMETDTIQYNYTMMPFSRNIARDGDFVMPVVGDSMTPKYPNGTYVLVRPLPTWREYIELGATYVLELLDGRRIIKDVRAGEDHDHFRLISVNPQFDPTDIAKNFIQHIFAVIVAVRRELNW